MVRKIEKYLNKYLTNQVGTYATLENKLNKHNTLKKIIVIGMYLNCFFTVIKKKCQGKISPKLKNIK